MNWDIQHILMTPPITETTINSVFLSPEFRVIVYLLMAILLILGTLLFSVKKMVLPDAFRKAMIAAFFVSGLLYAVHSDIGWATWLMTDAGNFRGLATEDKLKKMDGVLYEFIIEAKKIVTDDYQIYSSNIHVEHRIQYFLLPRHKREQASYIIVIADHEARFDFSTCLFTRGDVKIVNAKPVLVFAQDAYILKRP
jgi:hypothetical protein